MPPPDDRRPPPLNLAPATRAALDELWALLPQAYPQTPERARVEALIAMIRAAGVPLDNVYPPEDRLPSHEPE